MSDPLSLPLVIGLCPVDYEEFYVPFEPDTSPICPACSETLVLYVQASALAAPGLWMVSES